MTRQFQVYLNTEPSVVSYSCVHCRAHLAEHKNLISKSFQGSQGRAYLFEKVVNVKKASAEDRLLLTGQHRVADLHCVCCAALLGWTYERAFEPSQRYKEGKSIIELANLIKENRWSEPENQKCIISNRHSSGYHTSSSDASPNLDNVDKFYKGQENTAFFVEEEEEDEEVFTHPQPSASTSEGSMSSRPTHNQQQARFEETATLQRRPRLRVADQRRHHNHVFVRSIDVLPNLDLRSSAPQYAQPQQTKNDSQLPLNDDDDVTFDALMVHSFSALDLEGRYPTCSLSHRTSFRHISRALPTDQTVPLLLADDTTQEFHDATSELVTPDRDLQHFYPAPISPRFAQVAVQQETVDEQANDVFCAVFE